MLRQIALRLCKVKLLRQQLQDQTLLKLYAFNNNKGDIC